jgi:hypothetical protein
MDFAKFVSLIDSGSLFFPRVDRLQDPFEGSWPRVNVENRTANVPDLMSSEARESFLEAMRDKSETSKQWPRYFAVSCWHMNEHESEAMWRLYLKDDKGVAVQSTYGKLKNVLDKPEEPVYLGMVKYVDYDSEVINDGNIMNPLAHKRKSFEHEREVRALVGRLPTKTNGSGFDFDRDTIQGGGVQVKIDVCELVERVYIAPVAPSWFEALMKSVLKRYGYDFEVQRSKLNEDPVF